jgi:hypothetical protein
LNVNYCNVVNIPVGAKHVGSALSLTDEFSKAFQVTLNSANRDVVDMCRNKGLLSCGLAFHA